MSSVFIEHMQQRRDTAADWTSKNTVLYPGEIGLETDTRRFKFGDGQSPWNSLPYSSGGTLLLQAGASFPSPAPPPDILVLRLLA